MAQASQEDKDLKGKLVLVTGGGSGVGRSACKLLAEAGAKVVVADINFETATETKSSLKNADKHLAVHMDTSSKASVEEAASQIDAHFGTAPSGVIHCAAIVVLNDRGFSSLKCSESDFDRTIQVNLKGTFLVDTIFANRMLDRRLEFGSIVNVSSLARHGYQPFVDYSASKAGVIGVTKTLADELGQYNIRVNAVAPSMVLTPMLAGAPPQILEKSAKSNPLRRLAEAEEVAQVCIFLLRQSASSYVNGQVIGVDGGEKKMVVRYD